MKKLINIIFIIIIISVGWNFYSQYNFGDYVKAEYNRGLTKFSRDSKVTYDEKTKSYKLENTDYNDAMFYKKINVMPNTVYKATCKVKTQNVEPKEEQKDSGAHISINNTVQKSDNVIGTTNEWKQLEFYFNSNNNSQIELGFRLGGYDSPCRGTAWFTDFTLESGITDTSKNWDFLCLIIDNLNVNIQKENQMQNYQISMTNQNKTDIIDTIHRFSNSIEELSYKQMIANCDIYEEKTPITNISYDEENGYYVSPINMEEILKKYTSKKEYDHIFVIFQTGTEKQGDLIPTNNWIGLGGMEYRGKGFSNIRVPSKSNNYIYRYEPSINMFPEEVLIHEFLHTLERNSKTNGYEIPALHDFQQYGYEDEKLQGQKKWYEAYMNKQISTKNGNIGLPPEIYFKKPVQPSDFEYTTKLNTLKEPDNILEELNNLWHKILQLFSESKQMTNTVKEVET